MPVKKILSIISLTVFLFAVIFVILSFKGGGGVGDAGTDEIIGKEMSHRIYNNNNELAAEINSSSSQRDFDESRKLSQRERLLLTDINAVIYKHGEFKSDVRFSGNSGYVENSNNDFLIRGNAKIEMEEAVFLSERFFLEGSTMISTEDNTDFVMKNLDGIAKKGLKYLINNNVLDLYLSSGVFKRDGKKYDFSCNKLKILKKVNRVIFKGKSLIKGADSVMKGREIIMTFNDDFARIERVDIVGRGYVFLKGAKAKESREISGKVITGYFNKAGEIVKIDASKNANVILHSDINNVKIYSKLIHIKFNPLNNNIRSIKLLKKGGVQSRGKRTFDISSAKTIMKYDDAGEIEHCETVGDTVFSLEGYKGKCNVFQYFPQKNMMTIEGEKSVIEKDRNRFVSTKFSVITNEKKLSSDKDILSTLQLKSENSIFSKSPVFVSSKKVEINDKTGGVIYEENVVLFQNETKLTANKVEISDNNRIEVSGSVGLSFKNGENAVGISGKELSIDPEKNLLTIKGNGIIKEGENSLSGDLLNIKFNEKKEIAMIKGEKNIAFKRKEITGESDKVEWEFLKKMITFISNASLIKSNSGTSKGGRIIFFLENEQVVIKSSDGKRSETKID